MGIFGDETLRLLREKWPTINLAMEELYAILNSSVPINIDSPVTISNPTGTQSPLTINNGGITFNQAGQPPVTITNHGGSFQWINGDGSSGGGGGGGGGGGTTGGGGQVGLVTGGGPGNPFSVQLQTASGGNGLIVQVNIVGLDPNETLPVGTPVVVVQFTPSVFAGFATLWS